MIQLLGWVHTGLTSAPGAGLWRKGIVLWHLQYFPYRGHEEIPSCTMAVASGDQPKHVLVLSPSRLAMGTLSYCRDQRLTEKSIHCPLASSTKGRKTYGLHPPHWPWRGKELDTDGKSTADAQRELLVRVCLGGCKNSPRVQLWTGRVTLLTQNLNIAGLSPSAFQGPWAWGISSLGVSWKAVLSSPISGWGAGICWSEQGVIDNATSIGPARRPGELLWVLQSLLGQSAEGRLRGRAGLWPRTHFS